MSGLVALRAVPLAIMCLLDQWDYPIVDGEPSAELVARGEAPARRCPRRAIRARTRVEVRSGASRR